MRTSSDRGPSAACQTVWRFALSRPRKLVRPALASAWARSTIASTAGSAASIIATAKAALVSGPGLSLNSCRSHTPVTKYVVPGSLCFGSVIFPFFNSRAS
jgi:hypothetical protein